MKKITQKELNNFLDWCYDAAVNGVPGMCSVEELAQDYLKKSSSNNIAIKKLVFWQITKCGTTGFVTGLGGIISIPVGIPADIGVSIYVQTRMIASIAYISGYDIRDDRVKTLVYTCLCGNSAKEILSDVGIKIGNKVAKGMVEKIPGKVLTKINQKIGFRLITKFGQTGVINLVKLVPLAGGFVSGGVDITATKIIAEVAKNTFC